MFNARTNYQGRLDQDPVCSLHIPSPVCVAVATVPAIWLDALSVNAGAPPEKTLVVDSNRGWQI